MLVVVSMAGQVAIEVDGARADGVGGPVLPLPEREGPLHVGDVEQPARVEGGALWA